METPARYSAFEDWLAYHDANGAQCYSMAFPENLWGARTDITLSEAQQFRDGLITMLTAAAGRIKAMVVANEPTFPFEPGANDTETWRGGWPSGSSELYAQLARWTKETCAAHFPDVLVVGPEIPSLDAVRLTPTTFAWEKSAQGHDIGWGDGAGTRMLDWFDVFSYHGYLYTGGTFNPSDGGFAAANTLKTALASAGWGAKPIWCTEFMVTYGGSAGNSWPLILEKICRKHAGEIAAGVEHSTNFEWGSAGGPHAYFDDDSIQGIAARAWWGNYVAWWREAPIGRIAQLNDGQIRVTRTDGDTLLIPTDLTNGKFGVNP